MTLPEIPKEENEQPVIKTCPDCGKSCKNLGVHQRYCKARKDNTAMKQEPLLEAPIIPPSETPAEPLIISDVQPYIGDDVAWFEGDDSKFFVAPDYIGIVNNIPVVLVQFHDGAIIPPSMIPGFIGMFKEDVSFESKQDDDEPFPPFPEDEHPGVLEAQALELKQQLFDEKITAHVKCKPEEKPVKKHWWQRKPKAITPQADKTELTGLIGDAINATG